MFIFVWVFVQWQDRSYQLLPYPLWFHADHEADQHYPRFSCTLWSSASERRPLEDVSSQYLVSGLSR